MKPQTMKYTHARALLITLFLVSSLVCLAVVASGQRQRFYVELGAYKAGTRIVPIIKVTAVKDKQIYDTVEVPPGDAGNLSFGIKVRGQCPEKYRLSRAVSSFRIDNGKEHTVDLLPLNEDHRSIGPDHGQGWEFFTPSLPFLPPKTPFGTAENCNIELRRREKLGESRVKLLNDGFNIEFSDAYKGILSIYCHVWDTFKGELAYEDRSHVDMPVIIRCMPTYYKSTKPAPPRQGRHIENVPPIESLVVAADPVETKGKTCPVYVNFRGRITADANSRYEVFKTKYRFVGDHNYQTDWQFVSVARGDTRTVNGRRFIIAPENNPDGTFKMPGGRAKVPLYNGWMTLEVLLPDGSMRSERSNYIVDCNSVPPTPPPRIRTSNE